jgi:hypothetical protein
MLEWRSASGNRIVRSFPASIALVGLSLAPNLFVIQRSRGRMNHETLLI